MTDPFRVLSWGCGLQSTTLAAMSALGEIDCLDAILTADTGWERQVTYQMRDWYIEWLRGRGMRVEVIQTGNIHIQIVHGHIPFWTADGGPLRRQCTRHFKIRPIRRRIRELLGYDPSKSPHPPPQSVETWLGITVDEYTRAKKSDVQYIVNRWPLLELRMHREDCANWLEDHGLPVPPKSACVCCPYRRASEWIEMRAADPEEFQAAVEFDEANRNNPLGERAGITADELYIWHTSTGGPEPLAEADLEFEAAKERRRYAIQLPMFACESGYCGI
jgi:hypothetical protein